MFIVPFRAPTLTITHCIISSNFKHCRGLYLCLTRKRRHLSFRTNEVVFLCNIEWNLRLRKFTSSSPSPNHIRNLGTTPAFSRVSRYEPNIEFSSFDVNFVEPKIYTTKLWFLLFLFCFIFFKKNNICLCFENFVNDFTGCRLILSFLSTMSSEVEAPLLVCHPGVGNVGVVFYRPTEFQHWLET